MVPLVAVALALQLAALAPPIPQCIPRGDGLVCGYRCTANLSGAACAQTPDGLCDKSPSMVTCWDPPPDVAWMLATDETLPRPRCVSRGGKVACGFACATSLSDVACANTPLGSCRAAFGRILCFDPAPEVRWVMTQAGQLEAARCESTLKQIACGYHCMSIGQRVACSASPFGSCTSRFDAIACLDPAPFLPIPSRGDPR